MAQFDVKKLANADCVGISGRFTLEDKDAFLDIMTGKLDIQNRQAIMECSRMEYIDSSGIGDLWKLRTEATRFGKTVILASLKESVRKTFRTAQLESVFEILSEEEFKARFPS
ncbi:MAG TPA: STAS domain-containing protein [Leptospiraceae bacterium]|nr:STAS domain-containing protein [Leptospiraceae bacterium]